MTPAHSHATAIDARLSRHNERSLVEMEGVCKAYATGLWPRRRVVALRGAALHVSAGEVVGLVGPNRAGKTTLVKILLGLCRADAGWMRRLGTPLADRSTLAQVGYVHEAQAFPRYVTARELLHYYGAMSLMPAPLRHARIDALLAEVSLADRDREPIANFSKGMVQRLALAQAMLNEPRLLVLDEPAEGMDLLARQLARRVLERHRASGGGAILISHSLAEIAYVCDRIVVLQHGEVAFEGTLDELTHRDDQPRTIEEALQPLYAEAAI